MSTKHSKILFTGALLVLALAMGACSGTLPAELPNTVEVALDDGVEELEFSGAIEEMGGQGWTVSGVSFLTRPETEIDPGLGLGDEVKVHARLNSRDQLTAREIRSTDSKDSDSKVGDPDDDVLDDADDHRNDFDDDHDDLEGALETIQGNTWTVAGITFLVTSETEIEGNFEMGDVLEVELTDDDNNDDWAIAANNFTG